MVAEQGIESVTNYQLATMATLLEVMRYLKLDPNGVVPWASPSAPQCIYPEGIYPKRLLKYPPPSPPSQAQKVKIYCMLQSGRYLEFATIHSNFMQYFFQELRDKLLEGINSMVASTTKTFLAVYWISILFDVAFLAFLVLVYIIPHVRSYRTSLTILTSMPLDILEKNTELLFLLIGK